MQYTIDILVIAVVVEVVLHRDEVRAGITTGDSKELLEYDDRGGGGLYLLHFFVVFRFYFSELEIIPTVVIYCFSFFLVVHLINGSLLD